MQNDTQINKRTNTTNPLNEENDDLETGGGEVAGERTSGEILREEAEGSGSRDSQTTSDDTDRPFGFKHFVLKQEPREKKAYYCSDFFKSSLDLYFSLIGEPVTNPMKWDDTIRLEAGKGVENALVKILKDSGFVNQDYEQKAVEFEREGVSIHGKIDVILKTGEPVEIKSINNKNVLDIIKYNNGEPRENYVAQLASYMDALDVTTGYLFVVSLDGLNKFLIPCYKTENETYRCGKTEVDIQKEYKRWAKLWKENITPKKMPYIWEKVYKPDWRKVDWKKVTLPKRRNAVLNGVIVGGSWEINYSPWKDKIIKLQGYEQAGYTEQERKDIAEHLSTLFKKKVC